MSAGSNFEFVATICLGLAIFHTFFIKKVKKLGSRLPSENPLKVPLHLLGEVELVFGFWAIIFLALAFALAGLEKTSIYLWSLSLREPLFIFVVMAICSCRPILQISIHFVETLSSYLPGSAAGRFYFSCLTLGPLLGSLITEPAAMTVVALILHKKFYQAGISRSFKYATLGLLFVNVSIGGVLTPYAAAPVLVVAKKWGWNFSFMLSTFGWRSIIAILVSTLATVYLFRKELKSLSNRQPEFENPKKEKIIPLKLTLFYLAFLFGIIATSDQPGVFLSLFVLFLGMVRLTPKYISGINISESLKVAFFVWGLFVLGEPQVWWLEPLIANFNAPLLFLGSTVLTAFTDNAALTYLGSQISHLDALSKYALTAGAITGGGLTVIANAPNPIGYGILHSEFGQEGIHPFKLFLSALLPTGIALVCFWILT